MPETCKGINGRECQRPVWSRGLCSSCYSKLARYNRIARDFVGPQADQNDYVTLLESVVNHLLPVAEDYARYISRLHIAPRNAEDMTFEQAYMHVLLEFFKDTLPKTRYNWIVRQINKRLPGDHRIPVLREELPEHASLTPQAKPQRAPRSQAPKEHSR